MLQFKKAVEQANALTTVGTVATLVGEGGYHELASTKNFKGELNADGELVQKKVSIKLVNKDGDFQYINCSKPVGTWLRSSTSQDELDSRLVDLATLPILELPQVDRTTGEPIMVVDEETGDTKQLVLHSISFEGGADMSSTRVTITKDMLAKETAKRAINFNDLVAI